MKPLDSFPQNRRLQLTVPNAPSTINSRLQQIHNFSEAQILEKDLPNLSSMEVAKYQFSILHLVHLIK